MRILIAGLGDLGTEVARLAVGEAREVFGLRRSPARAPGGVTLLRGDVTDPGTLELPPALDVAVYCVAADARNEGAYRRAYPEGLSHVLGALATESPEARVLFVSSTGVYGDAGGAWVDEETAPAPESFTGRAMLEAEAVLERSGFDGTSLRLGGIYGPGRKRRPWTAGPTGSTETMRPGRPCTSRKPPARRQRSTSSTRIRRRATRSLSGSLRGSAR